MATTTFYNGMEMLKKHLTGSTQQESEAVDTDDRVLNAKLKQCYAVQTKIEPFYSGGKVVVLPSSRIVCKCGSSVKVVSTEERPIMQLDEVEGDVKKLSTDSEVGSFGVIGTFECELDEIISFDACPASNTLISAHKSQLIRIWNIDSQKVTHTFKSSHNIPINHTEINKTESALLLKQEYGEQIEKRKASYIDAQHLTWATVAGNTVQVWNNCGVVASKQIRLDDLPSLGFIKWATKSYDGIVRRLFVAARDIYCIEQNGENQKFKLTQTLKGHYSQVTGLEWNESQMISAGMDKVLIVWDTSEATITKRFTLAFPGAIESITLLRLEHLYIASLEGVIRHMDLNNFTISPDNALEVKDGKETMLTLHPPMYQGFEFESEKFLVSTHLSTLYEVGRKQKKTKSHPVRLHTYKQFLGSLEEILDVVLWKNTHLAVANNTAVIKVYNLASGSCQFLRGHTDIVLSMASYEEYLVSSSKDNRIMIWQSGCDKPLKTLEGHLASVTAICFGCAPAEEPKIYSASEDNFLKCWSMEKCLKSVVAHEKDINAVDISPKGVYVATASRDKTCKIWQGGSLKLVGTLKGHGKGLWDVKFSLWDQLLITGSADTTLKLWSLATMDCVKTLEGHESSVFRGKFINSGMQAVSTGSDGTLRIWDLRNARCLSVMEDSEDKVWALDATPDGNFVITGSSGSKLTVWKDITEQKVEESYQKRKTLLETEQMLNNVIRKGNWSTAVKYAIKLKRPFALLKVIRSIPADQLQMLEGIVGGLNEDDQKTVGEYIEKWNTNTKTSTEAQLLLYMLLTTKLPTQLKSLNVAALLPYSEKHFKRLQKLQQDVCLIKHFASEDRLNVMRPA